MAKKSTKKSRGPKTAKSSGGNAFDHNIRFIVPMPGRSPWRTSPQKLSYTKFHKFTDKEGDLALEDYQAQFLMQREYLID